MRIKEIRKQKKLSQIETAKQLNIPLTTYNGYENNKSEPKIDMLIKIADFFNVSLDYLLDRQYQNKLDLSSMSKRQQNIIEIIKQLNDINLIRIETYAQAKLDEQSEDFELNNDIQKSDNTINVIKLNKGENK